MEAEGIHSPNAKVQKKWQVADVTGVGEVFKAVQLLDNRVIENVVRVIEKELSLPKYVGIYRNAWDGKEE